MLSLKKLQFRVREVRFHGHVLSAEGLKTDPDEIRAVLDMPNPTDTKGVQRFVGFVNYLSKFMPRLSEVCEPLRRLLDKDVQWHWLPKHDTTMNEIKTLITAVPVLKYYDISRPVTIQSNSRQTGLGCSIPLLPCTKAPPEHAPYASELLPQSGVQARPRNVHQ
uniref:Reverse transcriptase/retrotransposon-derived protein RNase H-like domain-containing protein n=1 Tax=Sander lucioperca TaxID=283035 RepID=A0A8C9XWL3_SANLU